jgi:transposase
MTKSHPHREAAVKEYLAGIKKVVILKKYKMSKPTLNKAIEKYETSGNFTDRPRSGRPPKHDHPALLQKIKDRLRRKNRKNKLTSRKLANSLKISRRTAQRLLKRKLLN